MANFFERLENELESYTTSERQIALFLLNNRGTIPFETAASIAERLDMSAVTVGRFCRARGFKHFRALKDHLRGSASLPWLAGDDFQNFLSYFKDKDQRRKALERQVELLIAVQERSQNQAWLDSVAILAQSRQVQIIGFQSERGVAAILAHSLQYTRPDVHLVEASSGHFAEILLNDPTDRCLVIIDVRRYSQHSRLLAEKASKAGFSLIVITDTLCDWASKWTPNVLTADCETSLFWSSSVPMMGLVNLLINDVVGYGGGKDVEQRLERISTLYEDFVGFTHGSTKSH